MSESKLHVKVGIVEFTGEGEQTWLAEQLDKILEKVPELTRIEFPKGNPLNNGSQNNLGDSNSEITGLSVLNIAGKLNCKSGSDLATAAAAYMHFIEDKKSFSREDISKTMKEATGFYKDSYLSNLTTILATLEKNGTFTKSSN